jgi:hypothetical protein
VAVPPPAAAPKVQVPEEEEGPACGWAAMYDGTAEGGGGDDDSMAPEGDVKQEDGDAAAAAAVGQQGLPLDAEGVLPFFFLDAYENMDGRPGEAPWVVLGWWDGIGAGACHVPTPPSCRGGQRRRAHPAGHAWVEITKTLQLHAAEEQLLRF